MVPSSEAVSWSVPEDFLTIQGAVDASAPGDTVLVGAGTWGHMETRTIVLNGVLRPERACIFGKQGITVIGAGALSTVVEGEVGVPLGYMVLLPDSPLGEPFRIEGLTLRGAGEFYRGVYAGEDWNVELQDSVIENCTIGIRVPVGSVTMTRTTVRNLISSVYAEMIASGTAARWEFEDCVFEDISFTGPTGHLFWKGGDGGTQLVFRRCRVSRVQNGRVLFVRDQNIVVEDCWFEDNHFANTGSGTVLSPLNCDGVIRRNVFVENRNDFGGGVVYLDGALLLHPEHTARQSRWRRFICIRADTGQRPGGRGQRLLRL